MGSRKKKIATGPVQMKERFFTWYRALSIMDKIAFKSWLFNYNRSRIQLTDLFRYSYFWQFGVMNRRRMIEQGYALRWWTGFRNSAPVVSQ